MCVVQQHPSVKQQRHAHAQLCSSTFWLARSTAPGDGYGRDCNRKGWQKGSAAGETYHNGKREGSRVGTVAMHPARQLCYRCVLMLTWNKGPPAVVSAARGCAPSSPVLHVPRGASEYDDWQGGQAEAAVHRRGRGRGSCSSQRQRQRQLFIAEAEAAVHRWQNKAAPQRWLSSQN